MYELADLSAFPGLLDGHVELRQVSEFAPVCYSGTVVRDAQSFDLYFRARHDAWTLMIDLTDGGYRGERPVWLHEEPYGDTPFSASFIPAAVVLELIGEGVRRFLAHEDWPSSRDACFWLNACLLGDFDAQYAAGEVVGAAALFGTQVEILQVWRTPVPFDGLHPNAGLYYRVRRL